MIIKCRKCNLVLTHNLTEVTNTNLLNENDKESFVQTGYYFISDGDFFKESKGKIIMNKMDLINTKNHFDNKRLNGCCGLDGLDGPNKLCNNGHEIGTEYSDCWMPHCMIFETESIRIEK